MFRDVHRRTNGTIREIQPARSSTSPAESLSTITRLT
jgi:hypothetical protein